MEQINFYAEDGTKLNGFLHKSKETTQDVICQFMEWAVIALKKEIM